MSIGALEDEKDIKWSSINGTGISVVVSKVLDLDVIPGQRTFSFENRLRGLRREFKKIRDADRKGRAGAEASKSLRTSIV